MVVFIGLLCIIRQILLNKPAQKQAELSTRIDS
jgi:hypothetical protein